MLDPVRLGLRALFAPLLILLGAVLVELAEGRPLICPCGTVEWWGSAGPRQSQMLVDWYSTSHLVHGFLFYAVLWFALRRRPVALRLLVATVIEAAWELLENSPMVIARYRQSALAMGYNGDSVLNSASDIVMMMIGFWLASRVPKWGSMVAVLALELVPLLVIRDNLALNIVQLVAPNDQLSAWQARGGTKN